jgi:hypothetical protein
MASTQFVELVDAISQQNYRRVEELWPASAVSVNAARSDVIFGAALEYLNDSFQGLKATVNTMNSHLAPLTSGTITHGSRTVSNYTKLSVIADRHDPPLDDEQHSGYKDVVNPSSSNLFAIKNSTKLSGIRLEYDLNNDEHLVAGPEMVLSPDSEGRVYVSPEIYFFSDDFSFKSGTTSHITIWAENSSRSVTRVGASIKLVTKEAEYHNEQSDQFVLKITLDSGYYSSDTAWTKGSDFLKAFIASSFNITYSTDSAVSIAPGRDTDATYSGNCTDQAANVSLFSSISKWVGLGNTPNADSLYTQVEKELDSLAADHSLPVEDRHEHIELKRDLISRSATEDAVYIIDKEDVPESAWVGFSKFWHNLSVASRDAKKGLSAIFSDWIAPVKELIQDNPDLLLLATVA